MFDYVLHFTSDCSETNFIELFNFLNDIRKNEDRKPYPAKSQWHSTYEIPKYLSQSSSLNNREKQKLVSQITKFKSFSQDVNPQNTIILLTVAIPFDESHLDVFTYRYLVMISRQLLRPQDIVVVKCDSQHYNKIGSYFILEALQSGQLTAFLTEKDRINRLIPMPKVVSLSPEWFPAIYLSASNSTVYEVLNNPLFDSDEAIKAVLDSFKSNSEKNRIDYRDVHISDSKNSKMHYRGYFQRCFAAWIDEGVLGLPITNRINSVSGMAQLLFAAMFRNLYKDKILVPNADNADKFENLLETCCDFSDCILQAAENMVSHSKGGVLSIRINENWSKVSDTFIPCNTGKKDIGRYVRISLVDFSDDGILNTIQKKNRIENITLSHVFSSENSLDDPVYRDYQDFLSKPDHVIHHYGLSVFSNVVKQYEGCFTVSSCSGSDPRNISLYPTLDSKKVQYIKQRIPPRIPGTEYDILLVLDEYMLDGGENVCNPSLLVTPDYIMKSPTQKVVFNEEIYDFFNDSLSKFIRKNREKYGYQLLKEYIVGESSKILSQKLAGEGENAGGLENCVFYFHLSNVAENVFGRVEIVAKILLQAVAILKKEYGENLHLYGVLYGLSENRIASFTRQFALFYHRSEGNQLMKNCQLYVVSEDYCAEVLFAGPKLKAISDYCKSRRLVSGTSVGIANIIEHVAYREGMAQEADDCIPVSPIAFDLLHRMEMRDAKLCLSSHRKWYYNTLVTVLNNDIHGRDLGCRMENVHIRTEKVHLHTFYEGQLLFSNTYWYHIFADYLCEMILKYDHPDEQTKVLLYGYETYSEQMLFATVNKLKEKQIPAWYALYENPKYITVSATSEKRIRYLNSFIQKCEADKVCIVYIFGIGTTLATMDIRMNAQLQEEFIKQGKGQEFFNAKKKGYVIIQTQRTGETSTSIPEVICDNERHIVKSTQKHLNFLLDKQCRYLVSVSAQWATAQNCRYCFPKEYLKELPLIQTNETSTIPLLLIKPSNFPSSRIEYLQERTYSDSFLKDTKNAEYLYYSHLDRSGNHYQFYVRTASLLNDLLESNNSELSQWFRDIKSIEFPDENPKVNKISVLVSPLHFSNEAFTAAVNQYIFDGKGYIINFDVKKEFRDSFIAKFRNYRSALEMMITSKAGTKLELNFYFVDDNIITGATLNRAKSLLSSMIGEFSEKTNGNISVNLFKGIIVLIDRNSKKTVRNFFDKAIEYHGNETADGEQQIVLPFYRFISLNTPSIRSYGDSCPLCSKVEKLKRLEIESSLTFVEQHWHKKAEYHSLKKLSDAKKDKEKVNAHHSQDVRYRSRGFRRLQCSEWIWAMLKREKFDSGNAKEQLEQAISEWLERKGNSEQKIEYLISFLKVISREHIVYQEGINTAALQILLAIFSLYIGDGAQAPTGLYNTVSQLIEDPAIRRENPQLLYELYLIVIARLCAMGSVVLCREKLLDACLTTGFSLEDLCRESKISDCGDNMEPEDFSVFLCIQMKKMLFETKDCDLRVEKLKGVLRKYLEEDL